MSTTPERYALVTGASRGIGRAVAIALAADHGLHILVNYARGAEQAEETARMVREHGVKAETLGFDVTDREAVHAAISAWAEAHPEARIEVLVNNAGITKDNLFVFLQPEDWHAVIDTSLHGFFNVTSAVMQKMVRQRSGRIINVTTSMFTMLRGRFHPYGPSKAALEAMSAGHAQELEEHGITVNVVVPGGPADTPMVPAEAGFQGTVRYFHKSDGNLVGRRFKEVVEHTAEAYGISADVVWDDFQDPLVSDPGLAKAVAADVNDYAQLEPIRQSMAGEDFCEFAKVTLPVLET